MKTTRVEIWLKIRQSLQYFKTDRSSRRRFGKRTALATMAMNIYQLFFLWLHRSHKKIPKIYSCVKCACLWFWTLWPEAVKSKVTYQNSIQTESPLQKVHFLMRYGAGRDGMTGRREPIGLHSYKNHLEHIGLTRKIQDKWKNARWWRRYGWYTAQTDDEQKVSEKHTTNLALKKHSHTYTVFPPLSLSSLSLVMCSLVSDKCAYCIFRQNLSEWKHEKWVKNTKCRPASSTKIYLGAIKRDHIIHFDSFKVRCITSCGSVVYCCSCQSYTTIWQYWWGGLEWVNSLDLYWG